MPRTADQLAAVAAKDIVTRAHRAAGPFWDRLSPDGRMVECKAILCDEMLRDRSGTDLAWWLAVQRAVINTIIPE